MEKLGLSQPLHDCNDTNHQADHVPESHFLGNNLGKMPKYQPLGNQHISELSDRVEFGSRAPRIGISKRNPNDEINSGERINDGIFIITSMAKLCLLKIKLFFAAIIKINKNKSFQILFHFNMFQWIILELDQ